MDKGISREDIADKNIDELRVEQYTRLIEELLATRPGSFALRLVSRMIIEDSKRELRNRNKKCLSRAISALERPALWVANKAVLPRVLPRIVGAYLYSLRYNGTAEKNTISELQLEVVRLRRALRRTRLSAVFMVLALGMGLGIGISGVFVQHSTLDAPSVRTR